MRDEPIPSKEPTGYAKIRQILDREWPTLRVLGLLSVVTAIVVGATQVFSFVRGLSRPSFDGLARCQIETSASQDDIREGMIEDFLALLYREAEQSPGVPYSRLMADILPLQEEIDPIPARLLVAIANQGTSHATNLSISVETPARIRASTVTRSLSTSRSIAGGPGDSSVVLSVDRVAPDEEIEATVLLEVPPGARDRLILAIVDPTLGWLASYDEVPSYPLLPSFFIVPGSDATTYTPIRIHIASDQTPYQDIQVIPCEVTNAFLDLAQRFPAAQEYFWIP